MKLNFILIIIGLTLLPFLVNAQEAAQTIAPASDTLTIPIPNLFPEARPLELVRVPAGEFAMGSPESDTDRREDECPQHPASIGRDFFLSRYEITQGQWLALMKSKPSEFTEDLNAPVNNVSWNKCQEFIGKLNELKQGTFRLPTEAEWEYACRAGTKTRFYWGDESMENAPDTTEIAAASGIPHTTVWITDDSESNTDLSTFRDIDDPGDRELTVQWALPHNDLKDVHVYILVDNADKPVYLGRTADGSAKMFRWKSGVQNLNEEFRNGPEDGRSYRFLVYGLSNLPSNDIYGPYSPAGSISYRTNTFAPPEKNAFGLYSMNWDVWEWCQDWYDPDYYARSPKIDPMNDRPGTFRVCRGGSKYNSSTFQRAAARGKGEPDSRYYYIGFRVAREK